MSTFINLTGMTFGCLKVLGPAEDLIKTNGKREKQWNCICNACGNKLIVRGDYLRSGHKKAADVCNMPSG